MRLRGALHSPHRPRSSWAPFKGRYRSREAGPKAPTFAAFDCYTLRLEETFSEGSNTFEAFPMYKDEGSAERVGTLKGLVRARAP